MHRALSPLANTWKHQGQAASHAGLYHLDIKPNNILVVTPESDSEVKVADFGLARGRQECKSGNVEPGIGTRGYMAPEVEQQGRYSHRSEMYSVGAVLYTILCGEPHFSFHRLLGENPAYKRHVHSHVS